MIKTKKQMFIIIGLFTLLLFLGGTAYAWFTFRAESGTSELIAGDIYLVMEEGNEEITLSNIFPETAEEARARNDNFITFDISGLNDSSKAIYYEIILDHGTDKASPKTRYRDRDLKFDLIEIGTNNEETYLLSAVDYDSLVNQRIYVNTIPASSSSEVSKHYKLRMWLSEDVTISDTDPNATYNTTEYRNKYASVKVVVAGDFVEKEAPKQAYQLIQSLASTKNYIASYDDIISSSPNQSFATHDQVSDNATKQTVYYYTGDNAAANSNVLFAGYCWQIIRTTDNGGVRIIYNGVSIDNKCETTRNTTKGINSSYGTTQTMSAASLYGKSYDYNLTTGEFTIENSTGLPTAWSTSDTNSNGIEDYKELIGTYTCLSSSNTCTTLYYVGSIDKSDINQSYVVQYTIGDVAHFSQMGTSAFNSKSYNPAYVGYMFNEEYDYEEGSKSGEYFTNATWNGTTYNLTSGNEDTTPDSTHHYICDNECTKVRYYFYVYDTTQIYLLLENGETIEDAIYKMTGNGSDATKGKPSNANYELNKYNSAIKGYLENWYKKHLITYKDFLDQTSIYCNDRSISNLGGWDSSGATISGLLDFNSSSLSNNLNCVNDWDRYAVENSKATLTYPIGLLTESEINLITSNYAKTGKQYWVMSPSDFYYSYSGVYQVMTNGSSSYSDNVNKNYGVRGVITLKPDTLFESGDGTYTNPYIVGPIG